MIAKHNSNIDKMSACVPVCCIFSSFLFNNGTFFNTVTTRIRRVPGTYGLWTHVHIGCTLWVRIHSYQQLYQPSLQSCQVPVVNYAARGRGMSLLETSCSAQFSKNELQTVALRLCVCVFVRSTLPLAIFLSMYIHVQRGYVNITCKSELVT